MSAGCGADERGMCWRRVARGVHSVFATTALSAILLPNLFLSSWIFPADAYRRRAVHYVHSLFPWSWLDILSQSITAYRAKYHLHLVFFLRKADTFEHRAGRYTPERRRARLGCDGWFVIRVPSSPGVAGHATRSAGWGRLWPYMVGSGPAGHRRKKVTWFVLAANPRSRRSHIRPACILMKSSTLPVHPTHITTSSAPPKQHLTCVVARKCTDVLLA